MNKNTVLPLASSRTAATCFKESLNKFTMRWLLQRFLIFHCVSGKITFDAFSEAMKYSAEELAEKADRKFSQSQKSSRLKGFF